MSILDEWDHCLLLNIDDPIARDINYRNEFRIIAFDFDPTAEKLAEVLYKTFKTRLKERYDNITMEYVKIFENENSNVTYTEL